jgi:starch phosphorylase
LTDKGIGVELVITYKDEKGKDRVHEVCEFDMVKAEGSKLSFELVHKLTQSGEFRYGFRMFPKNSDLPHRMNFCYVRWLQMAHI